MSYQTFPKWFTRLDMHDQSKVKGYLRRKIPFISGTMSPTAAHNGELESFEWGLDYYRNAGLTQVVMQGKYMGSRAQFEVKVHEDKTYETRFISRGGFPIRKDRVEGLEQLELLWLAKVTKKFPEANYILVDGELCPWSAMGAGLIEKTFKPVSEGAMIENAHLEEQGFHNILQEKLEQIPFDFPRDLDRDDKKAVKKVIDVFGHANYQTFTTILEYAPFAKDFSTEVLHRLWLYNSQLEKYSAQPKLSYEPFQVLKLDDKVLPFNNKEGFSKLSLRPFKVIDLDDSRDCHDAKKLYDCWQKNPLWFGDIEALEGVVLKPLNPHLTDVAPYLKVRNPEYLRLVYGPTYTCFVDYTTLYSRKSIFKKTKLSIKEWELGLKMLHMNPETFSLENEEATSVFVDFMRSQYQLRSVDPRL